MQMLMPEMRGPGCILDWFLVMFLHSETLKVFQAWLFRPYWLKIGYWWTLLIESFEDTGKWSDLTLSSVVEQSTVGSRWETVCKCKWKCINVRVLGNRVGPVALTCESWFCNNASVVLYYNLKQNLNLNSIKGLQLCGKWKLWSSNRDFVLLGGRVSRFHHKLQCKDWFLY